MRKITALFTGHATPRILLFYLAIFMKILASVLSAVGFVLNNVAIMIAGTFVWLIFFALLLMVAVPAADRFLRNQVRWLRSAALTIAVVLIVSGLGMVVAISTIGIESLRAEKSAGEMSQLLVSLDDVFDYNDATALSHQAVENLLKGDNPYAEPNIITAMMKFDGSIDKLTPLREGSFAEIFPYPTVAQLEQMWQEAKKTPEQVAPEIESKFNYPAGNFLLPAPFIWLGIGDFRIIYLILLLPTLAYVIFRVRRDLRIFLMGALLISVELWYALAAGETGFLYFPFLLLAWILHRRNLWMSALFMAVAIAVKQIAWFVLPFYIILVFRTMGFKNTLAVVSIIVGVFIAANAPFIVSDPELWITSLLAPITDEVFPLGVGIISLVLGGVLEIQSPFVFTVLEVGIMVLAVIWYFCYCRRYPYTGPVLAVLPLFFAWRSLWGYFFYIDIIVLAAIMINEYGEESSERLVLG